MKREEIVKRFADSPIKVYLLSTPQTVGVECNAFSAVIIVKQESERLNAQQAIERNFYVNAGIPWTIVRSVAEVEGFLREHGGLQ